jgi:hypothetical protein
MFSATRARQRANKKGTTELLLNFRGSAGSTVYTDLSHNNLSISSGGGTSIVAGAGRFGTSHLTLPVGGTLTIPHCAGFAFGTSDFTFEIWTALNGGWSMGSGFMSKGADFSIGINYYGAALTPSAGGIGLGQGWGGQNPTYCHSVIQRRGLNFEYYTNGALTGSVAAGAANLIDASAFSFYQSAHSATEIDSIKITKGAALYAGAFTPPAAEFTL